MNQAQPQHASAALHVPSLDCAEEFALVEKGLAPLVGLTAIRPDYLGRRLIVEFDPARLDAQRVAERIRRIGFAAEVARRRIDSGRRPPLHRAACDARRCRRVAAGRGVYWRYLGDRATTIWLVAALATASTIASGIPVARAGWRAVRLRALDMNALMTIAAAGALVTGDWFEAATAMFLFGVACGWRASVSIARGRPCDRSSP